MAWLLLKIKADAQTAEVISDGLMAVGALSASIENAHSEAEHAQAIFGEPGDPPPGIWQHNIVSAFFDAQIDAQNILQALESETGLSKLVCTTETVEEQDWVRATQSQFDPIKINAQFWIVPTWHTSPNPEGINIVLDPGLAFGTGSHPTTHLCLTWLTEQSAMDRVLDYGCGSGILSIAAKKLGANNVIGVDIDEQAIIASRDNAKQNNTEIDFYNADTFSDKQFDIVVANILSSALMVLAPALAKYCKTGGKIALSGILAEQVDGLVARYSEWFTMDAPKNKDAWILLTGVKR